MLRRRRLTRRRSHRILRRGRRLHKKNHRLIPMRGGIRF